MGKAKRTLKFWIKIMIEPSFLITARPLPNLIILSGILFFLCDKFIHVWHYKTMKMYSNIIVSCERV